MPARHYRAWVAIAEPGDEFRTTFPNGCVNEGAGPAFRAWIVSPTLDEFPTTFPNGLPDEGTGPAYPGMGWSMSQFVPAACLREVQLTRCRGRSSEITFWISVTGADFLSAPLSCQAVCHDGRRFRNSVGFLDSGWRRALI